MEKVKTGKEFLDSFFEDLSKKTELDPDVVAVLTKLYGEGKLTDKSIYNELDATRKIRLNENKKSDPKKL